MKTISIEDFVKFAISERNFKNQPIIIGFTGNIGVGKNYIASKVGQQLLDNGYTVMYDALANPIKHLIQYFSYQLKSVDVKPSDDFTFVTKDFILEYFRSNLDLVDYVESIIARSNSSDWRYLAQTIGADCRKAFGNDIWVDLLVDRIQKISYVDFICITDVRYSNELRKLKNMFPDTYITVRIKRDINKICESLKIARDEYLSMLNHESEVEIPHLDVDFEIMNN